MSEEIYQVLKWLFSGLGVKLLDFIDIQKPNFKIEENTMLDESNDESIEEVKASETNETIEENPIYELVKKMVLVYKKHNINKVQMPIFIDKKFNISLSDLVSEKEILDVLNNELINWTCNKFEISRRWFDGEEKNIYKVEDCYKKPHKFKKTLLNYINEVGFYDYKSKIQLYAFKNFDKLKANEIKKNGEVMFLIRVEFDNINADIDDKRPIYKYKLIGKGLYWDYSNSRLYAKKIITIANTYGLYFNGFTLDKDKFIEFAKGEVFPKDILENLGSITWYPEDYIENTTVNNLEKLDLEKYKSDFKFLIESAKEDFNKNKQIWKERIINKKEE